MKKLKFGFTLIIISVILLFAGCGQTGPLYLPQPQPPAKQVQTQ